MKQDGIKRPAQTSGNFNVRRGAQKFFLGAGPRLGFWGRAEGSNAVLDALAAYLIAVASQATCEFRGEAAQREVARINEIPVALHLVRLGRKGLHGLCFRIRGPLEVVPGRTELFSGPSIA